MDNFIPTIALILILIITFVGFHFYFKFMVSLMMKRANKVVSNPKTTDKQLLRHYKNFHPNQAWAFLFVGGSLFVFYFKKAYPKIRNIYETELKNRNIEFN